MSDYECGNCKEIREYQMPFHMNCHNTGGKYYGPEVDICLNCTITLVEGLGMDEGPYKTSWMRHVVEAKNWIKSKDRAVSPQGWPITDPAEEQMFINHEESLELEDAIYD